MSGCGYSRSGFGHETLGGTLYVAIYTIVWFTDTAGLESRWPYTCPYGIADTGKAYLVCCATQME